MGLYVNILNDALLPCVMLRYTELCCAMLGNAVRCLVGEVSSALWCLAGEVVRWLVPFGGWMVTR